MFRYQSSVWLFFHSRSRGRLPHLHWSGALLKLMLAKLLLPVWVWAKVPSFVFAHSVPDTWWSRLVEQVVAQEGYDFRKPCGAILTLKMQEMLLHGSSKVLHGWGRKPGRTKPPFRRSLRASCTIWAPLLGNWVRVYVPRNRPVHGETKSVQAVAAPVFNQDALAVSAEKRPSPKSPNCRSTTSAVRTRSALIMNNIESERTRNGKLVNPFSKVKEDCQSLGILSVVGLKPLIAQSRSRHLAGGEAQRIVLRLKLALDYQGALYLRWTNHWAAIQWDNQRLIQTLQNLRDKGNTVVVVEHDEEVIRAADYVFDFGPGAGRSGGKIVAHGKPKWNSKRQRSSRAHLSGKKTERNHWQSW